MAALPNTIHKQIIAFVFIWQMQITNSLILGCVWGLFIEFLQKR